MKITLTPQDAEAAYQTLNQLITSEPPLLIEGEDPRDTLLWLARVHTHLDDYLNITDAAALQLSLDLLTSNSSPKHREGYLKKVRALLYRGLAALEAKLPAGASGAFIHAGTAFDALMAVGKVLAAAESDAMIVDPYMDEILLTTRS